MNKFYLYSLILFVQSAFAQEKKIVEFDLETCVSKAMNENIDVRMASNNALYYNYEYKKAIAGVLPQLSANWNINKIYGTVFDQVSFQRIQKATTTSFPSANASIILFDGLSGLATQQQAKTLQQSATYDIQLKKQQLTLEVSETYFNCLKYSKTLLIYRNRITALKNLEKSTRIQVEKGDRQLMEMYAVEAQLETEKAGCLEVNTKYKNELNSLMTLMRLTVSDSIILKEAGLEIVGHSKITTEELLANNLSIRIKESAHRAGIYNKKKTFSNFLPTVSLSGTLASSYSSNGIYDFTFNTVLYPTYSKQLNLNFYQIIGLNVQIPLFSKMNNYYSVRQENINVENKKLELEKEKLLVQNQYATYLENEKTLVQKQIALEKAAASATEAWRAGEIQYNSGTFTFYEMLNALNKKDQSELDVWQNKVDVWLLQKKINTLEEK